jgi:thiosulfate/3-mercaptopyruvate sulfurtransferase
VARPAAGQIAATRALMILRYAGVDDVRLLDGGYDWWVQAGNPVETAERRPEPVEAFGATIPVRPEVIVDIAEAKADHRGPGRCGPRQRPDLARAHRPGERLQLHRPGGPDQGRRLGQLRQRRLPHAALPQRRQHHARVPGDHGQLGRGRITADKWVAFYCGTGWRASETWFYAYLQGWERIAVYDGGWFEWSADPENNPIEIGLPADGGPATPRTYPDPVTLPTPAIAPAEHRPESQDRRHVVAVARNAAAPCGG